MPSRRLAAGRNSDAPRVPTLDASPETTELGTGLRGNPRGANGEHASPRIRRDTGNPTGCPGIQGQSWRGEAAKGGEHERWATKAVRKAGPSVASSASDTLPHGMVAGRNMVVTRPTISVARRAAASSPKHPRFAYWTVPVRMRRGRGSRSLNISPGSSHPRSWPGAWPSSQPTMHRMQIAGPPLSVIQSPERRLH